MLKINGKDVECINVKEETDGIIKSFSIKQDQNLQLILELIYNFIKECKRADVEIGFDRNSLKYYIELETSDILYSAYKIVKHRNNTYSIKKIS